MGHRRVVSLDLLLNIHFLMYVNMRSLEGYPKDRLCHLEVALLLLDRGADPNARTEFKLYDYSSSKTPLYLAIEHGNLELALLLLDRGAESNGRTESKKIVFNGTMDTPLHAAIERNSIELALLLLDRGAYPNGCIDSLSTTTPLHLAIEHGHLELALLLLDRGADPNARKFNCVSS